MNLYTYLLQENLMICSFCSTFLTRRKTCRATSISPIPSAIESNSDIRKSCPSCSWLSMAAGPCAVQNPNTFTKSNGQLLILTMETISLEREILARIPHRYMKDIHGTAQWKKNLTECYTMVWAFCWAAQKFFSGQEIKFPDVCIFMEIV